MRIGHDRRANDSEQLALSAKRQYDPVMAKAPSRKGRGPWGPPEVMTIDDLAAYLQVSKSSLYKLAQESNLPGQKVGRHWRFHKVLIDEWLRGRKGGAP